jgi:hypothetical protein
MDRGKLGGPEIAMRPLVLLLMLTTLSACSTRRGGGGGGDDDDGPGDDAGFVVTLEGDTIPGLSAIFIKEDLPGSGPMEMVLASSGMTCAAYQAYWEVAGPVYLEAWENDQLAGLPEELWGIFPDLPGMPGWLGSIQFDNDLVDGESLNDGDVVFSLIEYLDEPGESADWGPFDIGGRLVTTSNLTGELDTAEDPHAGSLEDVVAWYPNFDPTGPNTAAEREASVAFDAPLCDLEDVLPVED